MLCRIQSSVGHTMHMFSILHFFFKLKNMNAHLCVYIHYQQVHQDEKTSIMVTDIMTSVNDETMVRT